MANGQFWIGLILLCLAITVIVEIMLEQADRIKELKENNNALRLALYVKVRKLDI